MSILQDLIPRPTGSVRETTGVALPLNRIRSVSGDAATAQMLSLRLNTFGLDVEPVEAGGVITVETGRADAGWTLEITAEGVRIAAATAADCGYAAEALVQLIALAARAGLDADALPAGRIDDCARYPWRGFMIDSARHFQSVAHLKLLIDALSALRFNVFHWHLTDHESWRLGAALGDPALAAVADLDAGQYSRADIAEVVDHARARHIEIIPEIDLPGHNAALCKAHPELACAPAHPAGEVCLGKPEVRRYLSALIREIIALFPDSRYLHIGGDEAETRQWDQCPDCRQAMTAAGLASVRDLENHFMREMAQTVLDAGRTPIVWATEGTFPADVVIQCWYHLTDIIKVRQRGNRYINSVHSGTYLDYPASPEELYADWMPLLSEEGVYLYQPALLTGNNPGPNLLGTEYCLWTETVPQWRLFAKTVPRLWSAAEVAWGSSRGGDYADLVRRRKQLELAGYHW